MKNGVLIIFFMSLVTISLMPQDIISFDEYLPIIEEKLPEIALYENTLDRKRADINQAKQVFDVHFNSSFAGSGMQPKAENENMDPGYSAGFTGDFSFSSTLPSGTRLSLGGAYSQFYASGEGTRLDYSTMPFSSVDYNYASVSYDPVIKLSISQPLIYNWFGFIDRYGVKDAKSKYAIEVLKQETNKQNALNYYKKLYFQWVEYRSLLKLLDKTLSNARILANQTNGKVKTGIAENDDYQRAVYAVLKYEEQIKSLSLTLEAIENELGLFFDPEIVQPDMDDFDRIFDEFSALPKSEVEFFNTRNAKVLSLSKKNMDDLKKVRKNQALPQLNLFATMDIKFNITESDIDGEVDHDTSYGDVNFNAGLQFKYPLGNIKARSEIKSVEGMIKDILLQYEITHNTYKKQLQNILTNLEGNHEILDIKGQVLTSLRLRYETENLKYKQGRIELKNLIDTDNAITDELINIIKLKTSIVFLNFDYLNITQ